MLLKQGEELLYLVCTHELSSALVRMLLVNSHITYLWLSSPSSIFLAVLLG